MDSGPDDFADCVAIARTRIGLPCGDKLATLGCDPMPMTSAEFGVYVAKEIALNAALVKAIGLKPI